MTGKFITVAEYATVKGISKQAVYKKLNNELNRYVSTVEKKKMLDIACLTEDEQRRLNNRLNHDNSNRIEQPIKPFSTDDGVIDHLQKQLEQQNEIILKLTETIERKDNEILSMLNSIRNMQSSINSLSDSVAMLTADRHDRNMVALPVPETNTADNSESDSTSRESDKRPFWKRLFNKMEK